MGWSESLRDGKRRTSTTRWARRLDEQWAGFWPNQGDEHPMAEAMNRARKYVVSTTVKSVDWENSTLLEGEVPQAVASLKENVGTDLQISGSTPLVRSLLEVGLLDELRLMIHPVVVK